MAKPEKISLGQEQADSLGNSHFLASGSGTPKEGILSVGNLEIGIKECKASSPVIEDIQNLSKTELRKKYLVEYKRWDNMKQRCKKGYVLDPRFHEFPCFLAYMGSIPDKLYTLDRIDNNNKTYSPENCRWADKNTQNNNKSNNIVLTIDGEKRTLAQWAKKTNQQYDKLYKRYKKGGLSHKEIVFGTQSSPEDLLYRQTPWPTHKRKHWERKYQDYLSQGNEILTREEFLLKILEDETDKYRYEIHWHYEGCYPFDQRESIQEEIYSLQLEMFSTAWSRVKHGIQLKEKKEQINSYHGITLQHDQLLKDMVAPSSPSRIAYDLAKIFQKYMPQIQAKRDKLSKCKKSG